MTRTTPRRRMIRQLSHRRLTEAVTFIVLIPSELTHSTMSATDT